MKWARETIDHFTMTSTAVCSSPAPSASAAPPRCGFDVAGRLSWNSHTASCTAIQAAEYPLLSTLAGVRHRISASPAGGRLWMIVAGAARWMYMAPEVWSESAALTVADGAWICPPHNHAKLPKRRLPPEAPRGSYRGGPPPLPRKGIQLAATPLAAELASGSRDRYPRRDEEVSVRRSSVFRAEARWQPLPAGLALGAAPLRGAPTP
jgi:hypothetical protein